MKCADCPYRKDADAVEVMDGGASWHCTARHTECDDIVCLLRMIIWEIADLTQEEQ